MIKFTVPGEPQGKARARTVRLKTGKTVSYTPEKTELYENWIKSCYIRDCGVMLDGMLELQIVAYFKIAGSPKKPEWLKRNVKPKKLKELMEGLYIRPTKKPDIDNIVKVVADSLNGVAYKDDTCIVKVVAEKYYSEEPRLEIKLGRIDTNV